jgi:hypothetical protein
VTIKWTRGLAGVGILSKLQRSWTERKFKKHDWRIIQQIPFDAFEQLIVSHVDDGWEIEEDYLPLKESTKKWECELKKGTSILVCTWSSDKLGQVVGPERAVTGLASKLNLPAHTSPQY